MGNTANVSLLSGGRRDEVVDGVVDASPGAAVPLRALELPRERRPSWPTLAALAVAAGVAAVALGALALVQETRSTPSEAAVPTLERSLDVLADAGAERYPLRGSVDRITLVVGDGGAAVLTLDGLGRAPAGSTYRAWVVPRGSAAPLAAAAFDASQRVVLLDRPVARGARVAVTLEPASAGERPSRPLRLVAVRG